MSADFEKFWQFFSEISRKLATVTKKENHVFEKRLIYQRVRGVKIHAKLVVPESANHMRYGFCISIRKWDYLTNLICKIDFSLEGLPIFSFGGQYRVFGLVICHDPRYSPFATLDLDPFSDFRNCEINKLRNCPNNQHVL